MASATFDIFMIGVGGQGIGLLSEALIRAFDHSGAPVCGVDTHGLAQRGGTVTSHLRAGPDAHSPIIREGQADMVIALERQEALRGMETHLRPCGKLVYYDAEWQPLQVRLQKVKPVTAKQLTEAGKKCNATLHRVFVETLPDTRMQNVAVMAYLVKLRLLPGLDVTHIEKAMIDLLDGPILEKNLELLRALSA